MSLTIDIQSPILDQARQIATAPGRIEERHAQIHAQIAARLLALDRAVVHVKTGRLRAGLAIQGPFGVGVGTLESRIAAPSVPYAADEAKRGGAHDFAAQTIDQATAILDQFVHALEQAILEALGAS